MFIDTHAHLNFKAYEKDWKEVADKSLKEGVSIINVGSKLDTSRKAVEIAEEYNEGIYAAVGLHPIHSAEEFAVEDYKKIVSEKVVAIGEIGLDYYYKPKREDFKERQKEVFSKQLSLAKEKNLPAIIHCRKAHKETINILKDYDVKGVIHCFTGKTEDAEKYLEMGFFLGFNGIIFKMNLEKVIKKIPLNRILLETDSPYLGADNSRNEPSFVKRVAKEIAKIKDISSEEVERASTKNAKELFNYEKV